MGSDPPLFIIKHMKIIKIIRTTYGKATIIKQDITPLQHIHSFGVTPLIKKNLERYFQENDQKDGSKAKELADNLLMTLNKRYGK